VINDAVDPAFAVAGGAAPHLADLPAKARAALFDGLKRNSQTAAAVRLLVRFDETQSLNPDPAVYTAYVDRVGADHLLDRIAQIWQTLPILGEAKPSKSIAMTAAYLIGTYSGVWETPIHDSNTARDQVLLLRDLQQVVHDAELHPGELTEVALMTILGLEAIRIALLQPPDSSSRTVSTRDERLDQRATIASRIVTYAAFVHDHADAIRAGTQEGMTLSAEVRHLLVRDFAPALGAVAQWSLDFWRLGRLTGEEDPAAAARGLDHSTLEALSARPEPFPGLRTLLTTHATSFYARRTDGSLPTAAEYEQRVRIATASFDDFQGPIQTRVIGVISPAWSDRTHPISFDPSRIPTDRTTLLAQASWLMVALASYRTRVRQYDRATDDDFRAHWSGPISQLDPPVTNWPGEDVRIDHRARTAFMLAQLADLAGFPDIADAMRLIVTAHEQLPGGRQQDDDVLAITTAFVAHPEGPISQLARDLPNSQIEGIEEFSVEQLVLLYQNEHYQRLADNIDALLGGTEGSRFAIDQIPILNQAQDTERGSTLRPVRHTIGRDGFVYLHGSDPGTPVRRLLRAHPITRTLIEGWSALGFGYVIPPAQATIEQPDLVLWRIPSPIGMVPYLRASQDVNDLLAQFDRVTVQPPATPRSAQDFHDLPTDQAYWSAFLALIMADADGLTRRRQITLQTIPEVNQALAADAAIDVVAPEHAPTADELTQMGGSAADLDRWRDWFVRLVYDAPDTVRRTRKLAFRAIPDVNAALAAADAADRGGGAVTITQLQQTLSDDQWLLVWDHVFDVSRVRRQQVGSTLDRIGLAGTLRTDQEHTWAHLEDRQRAALVHERERVIRTMVLPLLNAHDATANAWEHTRVLGREVFERQAAAEALNDLQIHFLYHIDDDNERDGHQAAALLRIATVLRDKLVEQVDGQWVMKGWDREMAWDWLPVVEHTLAYLGTSTALDNFLRPDEQPASTWIPDRQTALQNTYDGLFATMAQHQQDFGIVGTRGQHTIEDPGSVTSIQDDARPFGPAHPFRIDGITWEVISVDKSFTFNPPLIRRDGLHVMDRRLVVDGTVTTTYDGETLLTVVKDGQTFPLTNSLRDEPMLTEFSYAVMMNATVEELQDLAEGMETGTMFVVGLALDIVDLFPVAGQAAEYARILKAVTFTLANPQFIEIVGALIQDPRAAITGMWDQIRSNFRVETLAETLLLDPRLEFLERFSQPAHAHTNTGRTTSWVGRILRRLATMGRAILGAVARVVGFAHDVRDDIQAFVLEHPLLARVLAFIADHIYVIAEVIAEARSLGGVDDVIFGSIRSLFMGAVDAIGRLRFPNQLVTTEDMVEIFLDMIARDLGGKYMAGYEIVKALLQAVNQWDHIRTMIGDAIRALLGFDPGELLATLTGFVDDLVSMFITPVQGWVRDALNSIYTALPGHPGELPPAPTSVNVEHTGADFLDLAPLPRDGATRRAPAHLELGGGRPLSTLERAGFERELGQDLSHVRLHTGLDAERATDAAGARALTTGSHIILAPDAAPGASASPRVIRHELAHVLQQTGPRPPGSDATPQVGEPGVGLHFDPQAEAVARTFAEGRGAEIPPTSVRGLQPDFIGLGTRFVNYVTHPDRAHLEIEHIDQTTTTTGTQLIGEEVRHDVSHVGAAMADWINGFSGSNIDAGATSTFSPVVTQIKAWLTTKRDHIRNAIEDLAIDSSETSGVATDSTQHPITHLNVTTFRLKLERYLVIETGCEIKLTLRMSGDRLNATDPLETAVLEAMNLAVIPYDGAGRDLWDQMLGNSSFSSTEIADPVIRATARILLFARGFADRPWASSGFALDSTFAAQIRREAAQLGRITSILTASQFWGASINAPADPAQPGLWIATHGDSYMHRQPNRQSHHTTQYLLVQLFEQRHPNRDFRPFPPMTGAVATLFHDQIGFTLRGGSGPLVDAVDNIAVGTLDPGSGSHRGAGMPAILLGAVTHRRGNLHVRPVPADDTDDEDDYVATPASRVKGWFDTGMAMALGAADAADYEIAVRTLTNASTPPPTTITPITALTNPIGWLTAHASQLRTAIPSAMRHAYSEMNDIMEPALMPALAYLERTWYEQLAMARNHDVDAGPYHVTDGMVLSVASAAKTNNDNIMETSSHWG